MSEFFTTSQKSPLTNAERAQNPALPWFMNNVSLHGRDFSNADRMANSEHTNKWKQVRKA